MKKSYEVPKLEELKLEDIDIMAASDPVFTITGTFADWFGSAE